jgi:hypothetical protein
MVILRNDVGAQQRTAVKFPAESIESVLNGGNALIDEQALQTSFRSDDLNLEVGLAHDL